MSKVAIVVPGGVDRSGTHRVIPVLLWLIRRLSRVHQVHVFSMRGADRPERYELEGATVHQVGATGAATLPTLRAIAAEHRRGPFDLLHAFWASGPGIAAAAAAGFLRRPLLLHVTGGDTAALPAIEYGALRSPTGRARVRLALAAARAVTAPCHATARAVAELGKRADLLPLGVDRGAWPPTPPRRRDPAAPARLVHVASLNRVKDQPTLLRAARRLADEGVAFTLDIAGEDTLDGAIQRMSADLGLDGRVRFHGFLPSERVRALVTGADAMVLSSLHEGDPVAALEAAMVGVPVVGTRVGHIMDWAPDAAVAVEPGDDRGLAREIRGLLADEERRLRVAETAATFTRDHDADWSARRVLARYDDLTRTGSA